MDIRNWNRILGYISDLSDWLPFIAFILLPADKRKEFKILGVYLLIMSILKTTTVLLFHILGPVNNMWLYHLMALVEMVALYFYLIPTSLLKGSIVYVIISGIVQLNFLNSIHFQSIDQFNSNAWSINTVLLIGIALYHLFDLFSKEDMLEFEKSPTFIIVTGLLIYFSGSLFLYAVSSRVLSEEARGFFHNAWIIRSTSDIIKSLFLTVGLWKAKF